MSYHFTFCFGSQRLMGQQRKNKNNKTIRIMILFEDYEFNM